MPLGPGNALDAAPRPLPRTRSHAPLSAVLQDAEARIC